MLHEIDFLFRDRKGPTSIREAAYLANVGSTVASWLRVPPRIFSFLLRDLEVINKNSCLDAVWVFFGVWWKLGKIRQLLFNDILKFVYRQFARVISRCFF